MVHHTSKASCEAALNVCLSTNGRLSGPQWTQLSRTCRSLRSACARLSRDRTVTRNQSLHERRCQPFRTAGAAANPHTCSATDDPQSTPVGVLSWRSRRNHSQVRAHGDPGSAAVAVMEQQHAECSSDGRQLDNDLLAACRSGDVTAMLRRFDAMRAAGLQPSDEGYVVLLRSLCDASHFKQAHALFQAALQQAIDLPYKAYLIIMTQALQAANPSAALEAFEAIKAAGMQPNMVTYCGIISGLCRTRKQQWIRIGRRLWQELRASGQMLDGAAFRTGINVCVEAGDLPAAQGVAAAMQAAGHQPDARVYNMLIKGYARAGLLSFLPDLVADMQLEGVKLTRVSYGTLVEAHAAAGQLSLASQWAAAARIAGMGLDAWVYTALVKGYVKAGDVKGAETVMGDMATAGVQPNAVTYTLLLEGHVQAGELKAARGVIERMEAARQAPTAVTYNTLLRGYALKGRAGRGGVLWVMQRMKAAGLGPNLDSFNTLMGAALAGGDLATVEHLFQRLQEAGHRPDSISYTTLMQAYSNMGQINKAVATFKQLEADTYAAVDVPALNAYIAALATAGRLRVATSLLHRANKVAQQAGRPPPVQAYGAVVLGHARKWDLAGALAVMQALIDAGGRPDGRLYNALLDLALRVGDFERALQMVRTMEQWGWEVDKARYKEVFAEVCRREEAEARAASRRRGPDGLPAQDCPRRRETLERFKFWLGLPNDYYRSE